MIRNFGLFGLYGDQGPWPGYRWGTCTPHHLGRAKYRTARLSVASSITHPLFRASCICSGPAPCCAHVALVGTPSRHMFAVGTNTVPQDLAPCVPVDNSNTRVLPRTRCSYFSSASGGNVHRRGFRRDRISRLLQEA